MVALSRVQKVIDAWNIKEYSTQFSGSVYHVCEEQKDSWGTEFKDLEKAEAELSKRRAEAVQKLFNSF